MGDVKRSNQSVSSVVPWAAFNRFQHAPSFFGIVREDGTWEDSAVAFNTALTWCCCADGATGLITVAEQLQYISTSKWSIIHSSILERMYEKGLIK